MFKFIRDYLQRSATNNAVKKVQNTISAESNNLKSKWSNVSNRYLGEEMQSKIIDTIAGKVIQSKVVSKSNIPRCTNSVKSNSSIYRHQDSDRYPKYNAGGDRYWTIEDYLSVYDAMSPSGCRAHEIYLMYCINSRRIKWSKSLPFGRIPRYWWFRFGLTDELLVDVVLSLVDRGFVSNLDHKLSLTDMGILELQNNQQVIFGFNNPSNHPNFNAWVAHQVVCLRQNSSKSWDVILRQWLGEQIALNKTDQFISSGIRDLRIKLRAFIAGMSRTDVAIERLKLQTGDKFDGKEYIEDAFFRGVAVGAMTPNRKLLKILEEDKKYKSNKNVDDYIKFWEGVWSHGEDPRMNLGIHWRYTLPNLYIKAGRYDDALNFLHRHVERNERYYETIERINRKRNAKENLQSMDRLPT